MTKKQLKQLKRMRRWVATTHWIQGNWRAFKSRKTGKFLGHLVSRYNKKSVKECWCLEGMILKACGRDPGSSSCMISSSAYDLKTELGTRATSEVNQLARIVWRGIKKLHPHARFGIPTWNDSRTRTKEQVLEVLDYLIAEGEAGRA